MIQKDGLTIQIQTEHHHLVNLRDRNEIIMILWLIQQSPPWAPEKPPDRNLSPSD